MRTRDPLIKARTHIGIKGKKVTRRVRKEILEESGIISVQIL